MVNQDVENGLLKVVLVKPDKLSTYPIGPIYRGMGCD